MIQLFDTPIADLDTEIAGPMRAPLQMLASQTYDGHASIHEDDTAQKLGFKGGTIEGPTHFSQFDPLAVHLFGEAWFETGCISVQYRNPVFEGEKVQAFASKPHDGAHRSDIRMEREDGAAILLGTLSIGPDHPPSALDQRLTSLKPLEDPRILADIEVGMQTPRRSVEMNFDQNMGALYPFSLREKLERMTENSSIYAEAAGRWRAPIIPYEMLSVLFCYTNSDDTFPVKGPVVGLFVDQEIRLLEGPVYVGEPYDIEREVIALSGSRRTESMWVRSTIFRAGKDQPAASMLLNLAYLKESFAGYQDQQS